MTAAATGASYERDRSYVLAVLRRRCGWLDPDERESVLHDAYLVLLQKQHDGDAGVAAMDDRQRRAYLTQTALNKALDEGKRARRTRERLLDDDALAQPDHEPALDELAARGQTTFQVREIVSQLPERRQTIMKLRFFFDRSPEEIQAYMGIGERVYRRELERAIRQIADSVELVRSDRYCEERRGSILALVAGIAGPGRARQAREHLAGCPTCARWAVAVREQTRTAAALLPLPPLALDGWSERVGRLIETLAGHASSAKQHAVDAAVRLDPASAGYASALRPGTLAAAVAGCVAVGGGTAYCVVEGIPEPLRPLIGIAAADQPPARAARAEPPPPTPRLAASSTPAVRPTTTSASTRTPAPRERRAATPREAAAREFGLEGAGTPVAGGGGTGGPSAGAAASPAPVPSPPSSGTSSGGEGEFGP